MPYQSLCVHVGFYISSQIELSSLVLVVASWCLVKTVQLLFQVTGLCHLVDSVTYCFKVGSQTFVLGETKSYSIHTVFWVILEFRGRSVI